MQSKAATVDGYLAELPADRRAALQAIRTVVLENLDPVCREGMQYGMIGYFIPHSVFPDGYHCDPKQPLPFAGLASQKNHMSLYLGCVYGDEKASEAFRKAWLKTGKKLDMGKACIRFKKLEDVPLDVVGAAIKSMPAAKFIAHYTQSIRTMNKKAAAKAADNSPAKIPKKSPATPARKK